MNYSELTTVVIVMADGLIEGPREVVGKGNLVFTVSLVSDLLPKKEKRVNYI